MLKFRNSKMDFKSNPFLWLYSPVTCYFRPVSKPLKTDFLLMRDRCSADSQSNLKRIALGSFATLSLLTSDHDEIFLAKISTCQKTLDPLYPSGDFTAKSNSVFG